MSSTRPSWLPRKRLYIPMVIVALFLAIALVASAAAPPDVDTFTDALTAFDVLVGNTSFATTYVGTPNANILGEYRDVYVYNVTGNKATVGVSGGTFRHSQTSGGKANTVLTYRRDRGRLWQRGRPTRQRHNLQWIGGQRPDHVQHQERLPFPYHERGLCDGCPDQDLRQL